MFPLLAKRSRTTFGLLLTGVTVLLVVTALAKWQAPLIGIVGVGLPLLFVLYLSERGAFAQSRANLVIAATLGIVFGVGWALGVEAAIARSGPDALGTPVSTTRLLLTSLAIPLTFLALLLAPVLIVRLRRTGRRKSLDGYGIGALGAYCFAAAGTLTRLASQLTAGLVAEPNRSATGLAVAAAIQGLAIPLTAAAVGGAVGATLWFTPRSDSTRSPRWYDLTSPVPSIAFGVLGYLGLGVIDLTTLAYGVQMAIYALLAVLALYVQRVVLHSTLLHEAPDDPPHESARCPECGQVVSELPFCGNCGVVVHAAPATTRTLRPLLVGAGGAALVMASSAALSLWLTPPEPNYVCPPDCGRPPLHQPVATNPRFTPIGGEFSVSYPGEGTAYSATFEPNGVVLDLLAGDGGALRLFGEPAAGRSARQIVDDVIRGNYPDASTAYEIPNALVGYQLGYGEVADVYPANSIGDQSRLRVLVMAAIKNDYALVAAGAGPYREFSPDFGSGHPSGANFLLALDMGKYVNSFRWRGDPPR